MPQPPNALADKYLRHHGSEPPPCGRSCWRGASLSGAKAVCIVLVVEAEVEIFLGRREPTTEWAAGAERKRVTEDQPTWAAWEGAQYLSDKHLGDEALGVGDPGEDPVLLRKKVSPPPPAQGLIQRRLLQPGHMSRHVSHAESGIYGFRQ